MTRLIDTLNDELRFADRVAVMQNALRLLGSEIVSGSNSFATVGNSASDILGLNAVASGTAITLRWDPVLALNLRYYEVQIGSAIDLTDGVIQIVNAPEYTDVDGGPGVTRYARVRVVLADGTPAAWSSTINLNSGFLITDSLQFEAALNYSLAVYGDGTGSYLCEALTGKGGGVTARVDAASYIDSAGTNGGSGVYIGSDLQALYPGAVPISTIGGPVHLRASMTASIFFNQGAGFLLAVLRDGVPVLNLGRVGYPKNTSMPGTVVIYSPGVSFIEVPPPGNHVYEIEVRAEQTLGGGATFASYGLRMAALEYRR